MKKIDRHYHLSEELLKEINNKSKDKFKTEVGAIEHYLKKGLEFEEYIKEQNNIEKKIDNCNKELYFIKRTIIQMFLNSFYRVNRKIKDDEVYNEYIKNIFKDKYND